MGVCENDTTAVALCSLGTWTLCWNDRKNLHEVWSLRLKTEPGNSSSLCSTIIKSCVFILQPHFYKMGGPALPFSHSSASELSGESWQLCDCTVTNALTARGGQEHQALLKCGMIADTAGWQTVRQYHLWLGSATKLISRVNPSACSSYLGQVCGLLIKVCAGTWLQLCSFWRMS